MERIARAGRVPMPFPTLTATSACHALAQLGVDVAPMQIRIEAREERWVARLPDNRLAWFAASPEGVRRLTAERRVLQLLAQRCSFAVPRVLLESPSGEIDVRTLVPGIAEPWRLYDDVRDDPQLAARIGAALGVVLAQQHMRIVEHDVGDWLQRRPRWPATRAWVSERLPRVIDDLETIADADGIMAAYERVAVAESDRVLVHSDLGLHNLAIDARTRELTGVFDYDDAAWADRHHDFRYLVLDVEHDALLDAAIASYESLVGRKLQRARVLLYNAACAITFLADRVDTQPEGRPCGRTLEQDLRWSKQAIARSVGPPTQPDPQLPR
jgi:Ser/Thr protein kinase RdoA (MazF antagonist)